MKPETKDYVDLAKSLLEENLDIDIICTIIEEVGKDNRTNLIRSDKENKNEPWRSEPATQKQKELLDKYSVSYNDSLSKGEASDLIEKHKYTKVTEEVVKK